VLSALAVWHPIRHNYFVSDDFDHLYDIVTKRLPQLLDQFWGGHLYVVRNAIFYGLFHVFGPDPRGYFWTVLLTHLLNTALLYLVIRRFTGDRVLACAGATLWGTCPTLEGALGWFSVYGQVFLTTIVLGVLASLGRRLETGAALSPGRAAAWAVGLGLGSTCFGMGLGLAAGFPLAAALALPRQQLPLRSAAVLVLGAVVTLATYELLRVYSPGAGPLDLTIFSVESMMGTAPEALVFTGHLLAFGTVALLVAFLGFDGRYPDVVTTATVVVAATAFLTALSCATTSIRRRLLALTLLVVAAYGSVALGRTTLVVLTNMSLSWAGSRPRYHYLPLALLAALLATALAALAMRARTLRRPIHAVSALWAAAAVVLLVTRPLAIQHWPEARADSEAFVKLVHDTVTATPPGQVALIENRPFGPKRAFPDALIGSVGAFVIFFPEDTVEGRPVRFAVDEHQWELAQSRGGRVAGLVMRSGTPPAVR